MAKKPKRFVKAAEESVGLGISAMVLVDRETGAHYLCYSAGYGGGVTPLLGADGKPVVSLSGIDRLAD